MSGLLEFFSDVIGDNLPGAVAFAFIVYIATQIILSMFQHRADRRAYRYERSAATGRMRFEKESYHIEKLSSALLRLVAETEALCAKPAVVFSAADRARWIELHQGCRAPWRGGSVHQLSEPPRWLAVLRRARRPRRGTLARDARFGFHGNQRRAGSQAARALGRRPVEVALPPRGAARGCVSSCPAWSRCPSDGNRSSCGRVRCGCPGICIRCHGQGAGSGGALRAVRRLRRVPPARQRAGQPRRPLAEDEGLGRERVEVAFREHIPLLRRAVPLREGTSPLSRQSPSTRTAQNLRRCCRFRRLGGMGFFLMYF